MADSVLFPHYHEVPKDVVANAVYRKELSKACSRDFGKRKQELVKCREDVLYWINAYVWTYNPKIVKGPTIVPFVTYPVQDEFVAKLLEVWGIEPLWILKSREVAGTWLPISVAFHDAMFSVRQAFTFLSWKEEKVDNPDDPDSMFVKLDILREYLPGWMLSGDDVTRKARALIFNETKSVINGESANKHAARSGRRKVVVIDEMAFIPKSEKVFRAVMFNTDCAIMPSTPDGYENHFYALKDSKIKKFYLHWSDIPPKAQGLYSCEDGKVKLLDEAYWSAEPDRAANYPFRRDPAPGDLKFRWLRSPWFDKKSADVADDQRTIASELNHSFEESVDRYFSMVLVERLKRETVRPPLMRGTLLFDESENQPLRFTDDPLGVLKLWLWLAADEFPPRTEYSMGADVGFGVGVTNSVLSVARDMDGVKVAEYATSKVDQTVLAHVAVALCRWFNDAFLAADNGGGNGRQFLEVVEELGYHNIYRYKPFTKVGRKSGDEKPGYPNTPKGKVVLLAHYREQLISGGFVNPSGPAVEELTFFIPNSQTKTIDCERRRGLDFDDGRENHGDRVIADALACIARKSRIKYRRKNERPTNNYWSPESIRRREKAAGLCFAEPQLAGWMKV